MQLMPIMRLRNNATSVNSLQIGASTRVGYDASAAREHGKQHCEDDHAGASGSDLGESLTSNASQVEQKERQHARLQTLEEWLDFGVVGVPSNSTDDQAADEQQHCPADEHLVQSLAP